MDNEEPKPNINMGGGNPNGGAARRDEPPVKKKQPSNIDPTMQEVLKKINEAESVLVALSNDPSVDELTAAMGLSMVLDNIGKRATAIYSGKTPNVLKFLKPEECFETGTESLQDFVIALNKDKADHLRYKIDGDYVKVYVTPYKTTISDEDLEAMAVGTLRAAVVDGDPKRGCFLAGQISGLVNKEQTCAEIITEIMQEAEACLKGAQKWVK